MLPVLVVLFVVVTVLAHRAEPFLRAQIVEALSAHFHARVELDSFHFKLGNSLQGEWGIWAEGRGLRIWPAAGTADTAGSAGPLIQLAEFRFHAPLRFKPGVPVHIPEVRLNGLDIHLPPKSHSLGKALQAQGANQSTGSHLVTFRVDKILCTNAQLVHEPDSPGKLPLNFLISHLQLTEMRPEQGITPQAGMHFEAELTNPRPVGTIHTKGVFGPWQVDDPGNSDIVGDYSFDHANLATFKEIAGTLTSNGHYQGTLRDITVDGETDTPDFRLSGIGNAMPLHTRFHATVDGTDGDTWLNPVDATLGHSRFTVQGKIVRVLVSQPDSAPKSIGHDIALTVDIGQGRIEDFTRLASHESTPLLTGVLALNASLDVPPGTTPVLRRMTMDGHFALDQAQFTNPGVQARMRELSLRGQGKLQELKSPEPTDVQADILGDFRVVRGVITLPKLAFAVPGAGIDLKGTYGLQDGALDFVGNAMMQATLSKMVGGWKGFLLKAADPFFKKDGAGADIPIHIHGTAKDPKIGINFH